MSQHAVNSLLMKPGEMNGKESAPQQRCFHLHLRLSNSGDCQVGIT